MIVQRIQPTGAFCCRQLQQLLLQCASEKEKLHIFEMFDVWSNIINYYPLCISNGIECASKLKSLDNVLKIVSMYPHPYLQTLLRIMGQEDPGNDSNQVEGEVCNLEENPRRRDNYLWVTKCDLEENPRRQVTRNWFKPQRGACPHSVQGARRRPCRNR